MTVAVNTFGPVQLARRLGLATWQFQRGRSTGLIPAPDAPKGRWSASAAAALAARREEIRDSVGNVPDVGAYQAAAGLSARFSLQVDVDTVVELCRAGHIPRVGAYQEHAVYSGPALEEFDDRQALEVAVVQGRMLTADAAAELAGITLAEFETAVNQVLITPGRFGRDPRRPRRSTADVPLYRYGDVQAMLANLSERSSR